MQNTFKSAISLHEVPGLGISYFVVYENYLWDNLASARYFLLKWNNANEILKQG